MGGALNTQGWEKFAIFKLPILLPPSIPLVEKVMKGEFCIITKQKM